MRLHYKFLHTSDIEKVLRDGTVLISRLKYFRELEEQEGPWIGDRLEGASELVLPRNFVATKNSPELEMLNRANIGLGMFKQFAQVSGGGRIALGNVRFVHHTPDVFVYSASFGDLNRLTHVMCANAAAPYDACLKIRSLRRLERRLFAGHILGLDCPVSDRFERGSLESVQYQPLSRNIQEGPVIAPSPFKKDSRFKDQCETRLTLLPKGSVEQDRLIIKIANPETIFDEVFRGFVLKDSKGA
jgi:hypothetical protein